MERSQAHSQEAPRERPMALDRMQAGGVGGWVGTGQERQNLGWERSAGIFQVGKWGREILNRENTPHKGMEGG